MSSANFKYMDNIINDLENYKYSYEGISKTNGSYCLTFMKSLRTSFEKDPEMFKIATDFNKRTCNSYYNKGYIMGILTTSVCLTAYKLIKNKKTKNEGDVTDYEQK